MKNKILKSISVFLFTLLILSGCDTDEARPIITDKIDGNDTAFEITVFGGDTKKLTVDEYRYYIAQAAYTEVYNRMPEFGGDFTSVDWNQRVDEDNTLAELIEEKAEDTLLKTAGIVAYGEQKGIRLSDSEEKQVDEMVDQYIEMNGEEALMLELMQMGVTSVDGYKRVYNLSAAYSKVERELGENWDKYVDDIKLTLRSYKSDDVVSAKHILIMNDSEKHSNPKTTIEEVRSRALSGEDFNALMGEFNEDPGQNMGGYTFGKGEMVPEFEVAAFALGYDEISEIVESNYGYHIIKRVVGFAELREYILDNTETEDFDNVTDSITAREVMTDAYNAIQKIKGA